MHIKNLLIIAFPLAIAACNNADQPEVSIQSKDGNIRVNSSGLEKITDSTLQGPASISVNKSGDVSVNGKDMGINVDSSGVNIKTGEGKGVQIDSGKIKVNIGGVKIDIQK